MGFFLFDLVKGAAKLVAGRGPSIQATGITDQIGKVGESGLAMIGGAVLVLALAVGWWILRPISMVILAIGDWIAG